MAKIEMRVQLQQRDLEGDGKWKVVQTSEAFGQATLNDYNGLAINVVLEGFDDQIRRRITGDYGT